MIRFLRSCNKKIFLKKNNNNSGWCCHYGCHASCYNFRFVSNLLLLLLLLLLYNLHNLGTIIPLTMEFCRIDPAHAGPVVAVMVDLCGVAIICTVCNAILSPPTMVKLFQKKVENLNFFVFFLGRFFSLIINKNNNINKTNQN